MKTATTKKTESKKPKTTKAPASTKKWAFRRNRFSKEGMWHRLNPKTGTGKENYDVVVINNPKAVNQDLTELYKGCRLQVLGTPVDARANTKGMVKLRFDGWDKLIRDDNQEEFTEAKRIVLTKDGQCYAKF